MDIRPIIIFLENEPLMRETNFTLGPIQKSLYLLLLYQFTFAQNRPKSDISGTIWQKTTLFRFFWHPSLIEVHTQLTNLDRYVPIKCLLSVCILIEKREGKHQDPVTVCRYKNNPKTLE